jgi:flagellar biosynthetic protein FliR
MFPTLNVLQTLAPLIVLVSIRVAITFAALPAPFGSITPITTRTALSVLVALVITLPHIGEPSTIDLNTIAVLGAVAGEVLIGAVIGLTVRVILAATEVAGTLSGLSMGLGFASSVDPELGENSLATAHLLSLLGILIFLIFRGHHAVIEALATSLYVAYPGRVFTVLAEGNLVRIGSSMLARGLQIASPVVATMFIIQLGTGLASKTAPRVQFFGTVFAISAAAGMITLLVAAPALATAIAIEIRRVPAELIAALGAR